MQNQNNAYVNDTGLSRFYTKVYGFMALGLAVSAVISYLMTAVYYVQYANFLAAHPMSIWIMMGVELIMVFAFRFSATRSAGMSMLMFLAYAAVNGFVLAIILSAYNIGDVTNAFVTAVGVFGAMAVFGITTKKNISSWGRFLMVGLIGLIIASIVNIFMGSGTMQFIISLIGVVVFAGLTAYDNQKLGQMYTQYGNSGQINVNGLAVMGALELYLDFINIFLYLLQIFGGSSRD